ncbi:MAG: TIGR02444 family protein [Pontibacterium sp.]
MNLDNALWQFALHHYAKPEVEQACLNLQTHGLSVNRLLHALWASEQGIAIEHCDLAAADAWRAKFTTEQRRLRYAIREEKQAFMDDTLDQVYAAMRKAELACEQVELALLAQATLARGQPSINTPEHRLDLVLKNLGSVLNQAKVICSDSEAMQQNLAMLLTQVSYTLPDNWHKQLLRH